MATDYHKLTQFYFTNNNHSNYGILAEAMLPL